VVAAARRRVNSSVLRAKVVKSRIGGRVSRVWVRRKVCFLAVFAY
jgi:hypothetical protein